ncbi:neuroglian-like [Tachypleus tridentatus]|uniref:neuroglian-like n=1 Tax=Tachypleus tridentatus TaxID=6853 RepID=UPI003FCFC604
MIQPNSGEPRNINSSRVTLDPEGGLHFSYVTLGDSFNDAVYSCFVSSLFRNELKTGNKRKLIVIPREIGEPVTQQPVRQYVSPANKLILRGDDLQLACIYGGMPIPTVKWYFTKKGPLPSERLGTPIKIGKILKITNISSDNEGIYQCIANNGVGSEQKYSVTVIVESLPYWNVSPTNTQAAEDENVRFECSASGIPPPKLHWLINGEAIEGKILPTVKEFGISKMGIFLMLNGIGKQRNMGQLGTPEPFGKRCTRCIPAKMKQPCDLVFENVDVPDGQLDKPTVI